MKTSVYLETSFIGMLTSWQSKLPHVARVQEESKLCWNMLQSGYQLFISDSVYSEISAGDLIASKERQDFVRGIVQLEVTDEILDIADQLVERRIVPQKSREDAVHIVCCAFYGLDYMLSCNCLHIANEFTQKKIVHFLSKRGLRVPRLLTPKAFIGEFYVY